VVSVEHIEVESAQAAREPRTEGQRQREVRVGGRRHGGDSDEPPSAVVRPGHSGSDDHDLVAKRLEVTPDGLDGGGHTAEHREVVVGEEPDPQGPRARYIRFLPKSSGFRFSSHSFSFS
jgi:hypothetical protein